MIDYELIITIATVQQGEVRSSFNRKASVNACSRYVSREVQVEGDESFIN